MPDSPYKLYVSDLDATLLTPEGHLSDYSRDALIQLIEQGLPFTIASARSQYSMRYLLEGVPLSLPVIEFNGACVSEWQTGNHLHTVSIDKSETEPLVEKGTSLGIPPFITTVNGNEDWLYYPEEVNPEITWLLEDRVRLNDPRLRRTRDMTHDILAEDVICITFVGGINEIHELRDWTEERFSDDVTAHCYQNNYHLGWYWLTVHPRHASKGAALEWLAGHLGLATQQTCVFGDNDNDITMFEKAGCAIAVENAIDSVKDLADEVIGPNTDDAVVDYLATQL